MRKSSYVILFLCSACLILSSCSKSSSLSSFSKRKYLKKAPKQKTVEQVAQSKEEAYTSIELITEAFVMDQIPEIDTEQEELLVLTEVITIKEYSANDSHTNSIESKNQQMEIDLNKLEKDIKYKQHKKKDDEFISAIIGSGLPWYVIVILLLLVLMVWLLITALKN